MIKKIIKIILPKKITIKLADFKNNYLDGYARKSYSQEGEDLILYHIFENKNNGFYVDIGAHHPFRFSNTFLFYKRGWRGINIDANPESIKLFNKFRTRDININVGIGEKKSILNYYMFNEPALNTFVKDLAEQRSKIQGYKIIKTITIKTTSLSQVLTEYLPKGQSIDFMSVDCEGLDFMLLKSNDWSKYRSTVLVVEILNLNSVEEALIHPISVYLNGVGYKLFAKSFNSCFFVDQTQINEVML